MLYDVFVNVRESLCFLAQTLIESNGLAQCSPLQCLWLVWSGRSQAIFMQACQQERLIMAGESGRTWSWWENWSVRSVTSLALEMGSNMDEQLSTADITACSFWLTAWNVCALSKSTKRCVSEVSADCISSPFLILRLDSFILGKHQNAGCLFYCPFHGSF